MREKCDEDKEMILGIESSGLTGGVALVAPNGIVGSVVVTSKTLYSQRLLPSVDWLMSKAGVTLGEVTGIAVSLGPGSFTGLRVGLSMAKGLAFAAKLPLVGICTLEGLALRAIFPGSPLRVCPVIDARQGLVYAALYEIVTPSSDSNHRDPWSLVPALRCVKSPVACKLEDLFGWISEPTLFAGDGALHYRENLEANLGCNFVLAPPHKVLPSPEEIAVLGARRLAGGEADDLARLEPLYIRRSYVEPRKPTV